VCCRSEAFLVCAGRNGKLGPNTVGVGLRSIFQDGGKKLVALHMRADGTHDYEAIYIKKLNTSVFKEAISGGWDHALNFIQFG
tara:strand:- start:341 stop:589 length:249 start_codon:yes stop_codon:yes gene_type:complete